MKEKIMRKQVLSNNRPMNPPGSNLRRGNVGRMRDYTPVPWSRYFQHKHDIEVENSTFRAYECGTEGPVLFLLHGGGYSGLSWALLSATLCKLVRCRCVALDLRGHGDSRTNDDTDLSIETLSSDVGAVINKMFSNEAPHIILIGHSMGATVAVHAAVRNLVPTLAGVVVIDVVEGTALEALSSMQSFLRSRPTHFRSLEEAIEWSIRSGQLRNLESAKVSLVGQLKRIDTGETATKEQEHAPDVPLPAQCGSSQMKPEPIQEEPSSFEDSVSTETTEMPPPAPPPPPPVTPPPSPSSSASSTQLDEAQTTDEAKNRNLLKMSSQQYTWRIDLSKTDKYWSGWFKGLSEKFLSCNAPKLLLLAGVDRLDKDLTIGQMQGKFQMQVLPQCGHAVHEDVPDKVADVLATFLVRYKLTEPIGLFERTFPAC